MSLADAISEAIAIGNSPPPNEAATCLWVIVPLLDAAGYARLDIQPQSVDANGQFPDYTILPNTDATWYLEAKAWSVTLQDSHAQQSLNYANNSGKRWVVLTNGREWRLYDNHIRDVAQRKLLVNVTLADVSAMEGFLSALGRRSVMAGRLEAYARRVHLARVLRPQLGDENSPLIRTLWTAIRREAGLVQVQRNDLVDFFASLGEAEAEPTPATPVPRTLPDRGQSAEARGLEPAKEVVPAAAAPLSLEVLDAGADQYVTGRRPGTVFLPAGSSRQVYTWRSLAVEIITWLASEGRLPTLPFRSGQRGDRYFLNAEPTHPDGRPMRAHAHISAGPWACYVDVQRSGQDLIRSVCAACREAGIQPSSIRVALRAGEESPSSFQ